MAVAPGPFAERWNGRSWAVARPVPPSARYENGLVAVSCGSARSCIAVGNSFDASQRSDATLAERWNGTKWTIEHPRNPNHASHLESVSCVSAHDCFAAGSDSLPLIERWNGSTWTVQRTTLPAPARYEDVAGFSGVSCPSRSNCTAVGDYLNKPGNFKTLAEHRNDR